jgi:prevent-host-death family protein
MVRKVTALKARQNLGRLLEEVCYRGDQCVIERAGRPMAAVVPVWQIEERQARHDRFFSRIGDLWQKNRRVNPDALEREVRQAVTSVRKQK